MSKAAGARKPSESQTDKALWAMKAVKDRREDFYDPARKDNILKRNQTRLELWEEHLKDPIIALDKALEKLGDSVSRMIGGPRHFVEVVVFNGLRPRCQKCGTHRCEKVFGLVWARGIVCVCAQPPRIGKFREVWGRVASSSSSLKETDGPQ